MTTITPEQEARELLDRAALKAELTRRWQRLRSGEDAEIPAEEVVAELFRRAES